MPIPKPNSTEKQNAYMARCMHFVMNEGGVKDNKQGVAICMSTWRDSKKKEEVDPFDREVFLVNRSAQRIRYEDLE
jgi:hypothetical protein